MVDRYLRGLTEDIEAAIADAVNRGVKGSFNAVGALAAAVAEQVGSADLRYAYENVAENMRQHVLDAYEFNVEQTKGNPHLGRTNRLSGRLRDALEDPSFVRGTSSGIQFVNESMLDREAAHWRRMNFGTVGSDGAPTPAGRVTDFTINGEVILPLGFFGDGPSPPNMLPPGFWRAKNNRTVKPDAARRGTDRFQPFGNAPGVSGVLASPKITAAIRPRRFLDEGFEGFAEQMPIEFNRLVQQWLSDDKGSPTSQAFLRNLKVPGGAQRIKNFRASASVQIRRF